MASPMNLDRISCLREGCNVVRVDVGVIDRGDGWLLLEISAWQRACQARVTNECSRYEVAH